MYLALALIAQSTNLLSSGSASIKPKRKYTFICLVFVRFRIARMIFCATSGDPVRRAIISSYSFKISSVKHRQYLFLINPSQIGKYMLSRLMEGIRQLVSNTMFSIDSSISSSKMFCGPRLNHRSRQRAFLTKPIHFIQRFIGEIFCDQIANIA